MTKEIWREKWLRAINELTSMEMQKNCRIIATKNGSIWTMVDFVNFQFDEFLFGFDYFYFKDEKNWINPREYEIIKDWHNDIDDYLNSDRDDICGISHLNYSKWRSICCKGILAKEKLRLVLTESENEFLK